MREREREKGYFITIATQVERDKKRCRFRQDLDPRYDGVLLAVELECLPCFRFFSLFVVCFITIFLTITKRLY